MEFVGKYKFDFIEVLFGIVLLFIKEIKEKMGIFIFVGGFICMEEDVEQVLKVGVVVVIIFNIKLWKKYE